MTGSKLGPRQLELLGLVAKLTANLSRPPHPQEARRAFGGQLHSTVRDLQARELLEPGSIRLARSTLRLTAAGRRAIREMKPTCRSCGIRCATALCATCADRIGCSL